MISSLLRRQVEDGAALRAGGDLGSSLGVDLDLAGAARALKVVNRGLPDSDLVEVQRPRGRGLPLKGGELSRSPGAAGVDAEDAAEVVRLDVGLVLDAGAPRDGEFVARLVLEDGTQELARVGVSAAGGADGAVEGGELGHHFPYDGPPPYDGVLRITGRYGSGRPAARAAAVSVARWAARALLRWICSRESR